MTFDFDTVIERRGTDSQKWQKYAGRDILPLWVADMDFKSSPAIIDAKRILVPKGGVLVGSVEQPAERTIFAFEPGSKLRMSISKSRHER